MRRYDLSKTAEGGERYFLRQGSVGHVIGGQAPRHRACGACPIALPEMSAHWHLIGRVLLIKDQAAHPATSFHV